MKDCNGPVVDRHERPLTGKSTIKIQPPESCRWQVTPHRCNAGPGCAPYLTFNFDGQLRRKLTGSSRLIAVVHALCPKGCNSQQRSFCERADTGALHLGSGWAIRRSSHSTGTSTSNLERTAATATTRHPWRPQVVAMGGQGRAADHLSPLGVGRYHCFECCLMKFLTTLPRGESRSRASLTERRYLEPPHNAQISASN